MDLGHEAHDPDVHRAEDERADLRLLPALVAVLDPLLAADEVDRVDHLVRDRRDRAGLVAWVFMLAL